MSAFASVFPVLCWVFYGVFTDWLERYRPSLSSLMSRQRRRWVANAVRRETPMDAILSANLMSSISFLASTTVLLILALFAVFGQLGAVLGALSELDNGITTRDVEIHLLALLAMFVLAFLAFTLSLRQFNHFCIMLGAVNHDPNLRQDDEITLIARINSLGARNFNNGIRAYYFAIASMAWFAWPPLAIVVSLVIAAFLIHREFYSTPRDVVARLTQD